VFYDLEPAFNNTDRDLSAVTTRSFQELVDHQSPFRLFTLPQPWPPVDLAITRLICDTYMIENGLAQGDRLSMASSVELRLPLVDYRLVETVIGLRKVHRDLEAGPKRWLRDAVRGIVPDFVLSRPKRGFTPPWRPWARALAKNYGSDLLDGYLVEHEILTGPGAATMARRISPPPLGMPSFLADRALLLELYCRRMNASAEKVSR
jgi:asparagine synthase (glutamine-hydrolysing)